METPRRAVRQGATSDALSAAATADSGSRPIWSWIAGIAYGGTSYNLGKQQRNSLVFGRRFLLS